MKHVSANNNTSLTCLENYKLDPSNQHHAGLNSHLQLLHAHLFQLKHLNIPPECRN